MIPYRFRQLACNIKNLKMNNTYLKKLSLLILGLSVLNIANAHGIYSNGFVNSLSNPKFNHLISVIAVGILSVPSRGKTNWLVPSIFFVTILAGCLLGIITAYSIPIAQGVTLSMLALGVAIVLNNRIPMMLMLFFIGVFGLLHGYLHGEEIRDIKRFIMYGVSLTLSTVGLYLTGAVISFVLHHTHKGDIVLKVIGVLIAIIGIFIFLLV